MTLDSDFLRLVSFQRRREHEMDGLYNRKIQEPIFKNYLQEMDDDELGSLAPRLCIHVSDCIEWTVGHR